MSEGTVRHRRRFTPDFRREAAHRVIDTGRPIVEVARELSIGATLLGRWVAVEREAMGPVAEAPMSESERAELCRLRRENADLRRDVEFLGKASAWFAARSGPASSMR